MPGKNDVLLVMSREYVLNNLGDRVRNVDIFEEWVARLGLGESVLICRIATV